MNDVNETLGSQETVQTKPSSRQMFLVKEIIQTQISSKYDSVF